MSTTRRAALVLAIMAALMAAPPTASAAKPNALSDPGAAPSSGSVTTLFVLSVRYTSSAGNPAAAVTASVAGLTVPLVLSSGTLTDGHWVGATLLPAGTWTVTFRASVAQGPQPSLVGPTLSVWGPTPTAAPPSEPPTGSSSFAPDITPTGASPTPATAPSGTASPSADPAAPSATPGASGGGTGGTGGTGATGGTGGAGATGGTGGSGANAGSSGPSGGPPAPSGGGGNLAGGGLASPVPSPGGAGTFTGGVEIGDDLVSLVLLVGMLCVAAITAVGLVWVFLGRERRKDEPAPQASGGSATPLPPDSGLQAVGRRALRHRQLDADNDPILAALGLGSESAASRAANAQRGRPTTPRQVSSGPGERPMHPARRQKGPDR